MLFRRRINRSCSYCAYSVGLDNGNVLCAKKGVISAEGKCRKFCYDPMRRIPPKPKAQDFRQFTQEDFTL